jgi:PAS domain S-box-containing protein
MARLSIPSDVSFGDLLISSYRKIVGTPLVPDDVSGAAAAEWLYRAPFGVLAQDASPDPQFVYANLAAQRRFEYSRQELMGMPSRLSAEPQNQDQRQAFMDSVLEQGYISGYEGRRIAKSGRRFLIQDVTVWNVIDADGTLCGQAALIRRSSDA